MPSKAEYPEALERAWLDIAMEATGCPVPVDAVNGLEREAEAISDAFTTGRDPSFANYATNKRALAAYGLYFFPRAYVRVRRVLQECRHSVKPKPGEPIHVLDLGAGTGAAGLAAAHELSLTRMQMTLVDQASESLKTAQVIFQEGRKHWPSAKLNVLTADARTYKPDKEFDIIISSFAINEWMEEKNSDEELFDWSQNLIRSLKPGGVLILLEPSQHESVDRVIRLRNSIAEKAAGNIIAPCPHHDACPMHAEKRGWCHEVRKWRVPETMHWINRNLQRDIKLLKFSFLAVQRGKQNDTSWMRIVSPVRKEKGKFVFFGCGGDGKLHTCEWMKRKLSVEQLEHSESLERGDRVIWENVRLLGDGKTERGEAPPKLVE